MKMSIHVPIVKEIEYQKTNGLLGDWFN